MKAEAAITQSTKLTKTQARVPAWVMPAAKLAVILADAGIATVSFIAAFTLREGDAVLSATAWAWSKEFVPYAGILYFAVPLRIAMLVYQRIYRFYGEFSYTREMIRIFKAVFVGSLLIVAWAFLFRGGFAFREFSYSRGVFIFDFITAFLLYATFHVLLRFAQTQIRRRDINLIPTLIVGTNGEAEQTIEQLDERPDLGYRVVGVIDSNPVSENWTMSSGVFAKKPVVGDMNDLAGIIRELAIQEVIITDNRLESDRLFEAMMQIGRKQRVEFRFTPSLFNVLPQKTSVEQIGVLPMVRLFCEPLSDGQRFIKRVSDVFISAFSLIISAPIWLVVSLLVKIDSRGPVFFRQERVGMDGRVFLCYKFRTMIVDSNEDLHREIYQKNIEGDEKANAGDADKPVFGKVRNDPRITKIGKWLRRTSIDELPQLFNVLTGNMSIVGPRPPIPYEVAEYDIRHRKRLDMKPGITGLWQVSGRNRLTFEEMVRVDLYYIENWSLWLDLRIIMLTLPAILRGDGAR